MGKSNILIWLFELAVFPILFPFWLSEWNFLQSFPQFHQVWYELQTKWKILYYEILSLIFVANEAYT